MYPKQHRDVIRADNPEQTKSIRVTICFEVYFFALDKFFLSLLVRPLRRKGLVCNSVTAEWINEFIMHKWTYEREEDVHKPLVTKILMGMSS